MSLDEEGFWRPIVHTLNCQECGLCEDICHIVDAPSYCSPVIPDCWASFSTNTYIRNQATSGGIFGAIAMDVLRNGGIVFGVVFDVKLRQAKHVGIELESDLLPLMKSKYLPSYVGLSYRLVTEAAKSRPTLFVGTPCQVAALRRFPGGDAVLACDLVCHGVPSQRAFEMHLKEIGCWDSLVNIDFRDKRFGWDGRIFITRHSQSQGELIWSYDKDSFGFAFLHNTILKPSCYHCPHAHLPRPGDLTLGDCWMCSEDIRQYPAVYQDSKGVSLILTSSERGRQVLSQMQKKEEIKMFILPWDVACRGNARLTNGEYTIPKCRATLRETLDLYSFLEFTRQSTASEDS
jgi:coenzyme F420-reducing hydrogenase beta subunit